MTNDQKNFRGQCSNEIGRSSWVLLFFITLAFTAFAAAQDHVTIERDGDRITLNNGLIEVATGGPHVTALSWIDARGRKIRLAWLNPSLRGPATMTAAQMPNHPEHQVVIEHPDGSVTVVTLTGLPRWEHVASYLHVEPHVAAVTCAMRIENFDDRPAPVDASWDASPLPQRSDVLPIARDLPGWYFKDIDVNVLPIAGPQTPATSATNPKTHATDWRFVAEGTRLPAYSAFTTQLTLAVVSGVGPVSAASDVAAISKAKDANGQWMVAVAPYGPLIDAQITVTAGLKTYQQTVNAGPRTPFIVNTPLDDEQIAVELRNARKQVILPPEIKEEDHAVNVEAISKQRAGQVNDALKAMAEQRWDDAAELSRRFTGDTLWMKLIGVLAEQRAGHNDAANQLLRRIVTSDPAAAEAWWLLGEKNRAKKLTDESRITATIEALIAGRLPSTK